jgi:GTP-binding protein
VKVLDAQYLASGTAVEQLPGPALPEIAFAGRSNVGKSSLLNALLSRRALARTSKTPGHTQKINLFEVRVDGCAAGGTSQARTDGSAAGGVRVVFADLPGYGYAARSKQEKKSWGPMIERYLLTRTSLRALVLLIDLRRGLEPDDEELIEFWGQTKKPLILVATKADKVPKAHLKPALAKLALPRVIAFSAETLYGRDTLWRALLEVASLSSPAT